MGSFVDAMLSMLFGWLQALINWIWGIIDSGGSALGTWFLQNWIPLTLVLIAGGLVVDWFIWLIRWRPYHVWGTRLRRIGRFFRRDHGQDTGDVAYAEGFVPEEAAYPEDESSYLDTYQTEVYTPTTTQTPIMGDLQGETYVDAPVAAEYMENPDFYPEDLPMEQGSTFVENPDADVQWADWDSIAAADDDVWPSDGETTATPEAWDDIPLEPAYSAQDAEPFSYRELLPLDDEIDDTELEPFNENEGEEPLLDEAAEMEAEEEMYDDFSNHGAPEPPQKRRRWEFSEDDAPATSRRRSTPDIEDTPPPRRNSRPAAEEGSPRRRRDAVEEPDESMGGIDPLAAYDAPEVMEQIQQPTRLGRAAAAPYPEEADEDAAPRRRRRSQRHRPEPSQEMPPEEIADVAYAEEPPLDAYYDVEPEATPAPRRNRGGRRGRNRAQARSQDHAENQNGDFLEEEPYNDEEPYYEEDLPRNAYNEDAYFHDDPYADDLPDSPDWPHWEEEPELPRGQRNRGVTKPSLIDRLRGMASPSRAPSPEEEDYHDDEQPYYDDEIDDMEEARPKKKGLFSKWLKPEQSEFQQPKPKPRVRQEDAYNEPVYPPKKRR